MYLSSIVPLIKKYGRSNLSVLSIFEFKNKFDSYLEIFLSDKLNSFVQNTNDESIKKIISQSVLVARSGGKRLRPYMSYLGYKMSGGQENTKFFNALVGIELFHTFALIHDDIIDESDERHSQLTVHRFVENLSSGIKTKKNYGSSQALLAGDLMFSWSHEALLCNTRASCFDDVRRIFFKMIEEIVVGQMIDVSITNRLRVSKEDIEEKNKLKTARYSFVNPLKIGAALAGNIKRYDEFFEEFGLALGVGYQVQDDLLDICGDSKNTGKNTMKDLEEGQHTYFTQYIFDEGDNNEKQTLESLFGTKLNDTQKIEAKNFFDSSGALDAGKEIISQKFETAENALIKYSIPESYRNAFISILSLIKGRFS